MGGQSKHSIWRRNFVMFFCTVNLILGSAWYANNNLEEAFDTLSSLLALTILILLFIGACVEVYQRSMAAYHFIMGSVVNEKNLWTNKNLAVFLPNLWALVAFFVSIQCEIMWKRFQEVEKSSWTLEFREEQFREIVDMEDLALNSMAIIIFIGAMVEIQSRILTTIEIIVGLRRYNIATFKNVMLAIFCRHHQYSVTKEEAEQIQDLYRKLDVKKLERFSHVTFI